MGKHLKRIENWEQLGNSANSINDIKASINASNARQIRRQALQTFGMSTSRWLARKKTEKAQHMLRDGEQVKNVVRALGYTHLSDFCLSYVRRTGMTPREFVRRNRKPEKTLKNSSETLIITSKVGGATVIEYVKKKRATKIYKKKLYQTKTIRKKKTNRKKS